MATSFGSTAVSVTKNGTKSSAYSPFCHSHCHCSNLTFRLSHNHSSLFLSKSTCNNRSSLVRAELNEVSFSKGFSLEQLLSSFHSVVQTVLEPFVASKVAVDGSSNAATTAVKSQVSSPEAKNVQPLDEPSPADLASGESTSEFITQVASLVKLVDSRDIVELHLKQLDCELVIRKKEVLPSQSSSHPFVMSQPQAVPSVASAHPDPAPAPSLASALTQVPSQAPAASAPSESPKSSVPPLKCPMAGTFYRSPAPGELPFVKVGDKVQKGQVLCIIEAMKLMNEIEADRSGTIVEILVEDGKPVSVDTKQPLFVIEP